MAGQNTPAEIPENENPHMPAATQAMALTRSVPQADQVSQQATGLTVRSTQPRKPLCSTGATKRPNLTRPHRCTIKGAAALHGKGLRTRGQPEAALINEVGRRVTDGHCQPPLGQAHKVNPVRQLNT